MTILDTIVMSAISSGIIATGVTWLAKTWLSERLRQSIQSEYATLLEVHRSALKSEADMKLAELQARLTADNIQSVEVLKTNLQVAAAMRQMRGKHLLDREVDAIAETYENLNALRSKVANYVAILETASMGSREERRAAINPALEKFHDRFRLHRLYLPRPLADSVSSFVQSISQKAVTFNVHVDFNQRLDKDSTMTWGKIDEFMSSEALKIFDELEREFRCRLGQMDEPNDRNI